MFSWLEKFVNALWGQVKSLYARMKNTDDSDPFRDPLLWCKDLEKHYYGNFSFATVQGNVDMEDYSQVETRPNATFVGVYDGHGGSIASHFIRDQLFPHLIRFVQENGTMSEDNLKNAFAATEDGFLSLVEAAFPKEPLIAAVGSCCLVGVIWNAKLHIANLGDSRAVKGYLSRSNKIVAEQLTRDHNASKKEVREELMSLHPDDSNIVLKKLGIWRIKGIIQVSRAIGDAYLKKPQFALEPTFSRYHLPEPIHQPVLRADPSVRTIDLKPGDKFLIFASDGLWEHVTNQRAVDIVYNNPRAGIAKRLVKSALSEAARKSKTSYEEVKKHRMGARRRYHDDITVVVIFLDDEIEVDVPVMSVLGGVDKIGPSMFNILDETKPNVN